jgi:uncharacterized membrane protein YgcG
MNVRDHSGEARDDLVVARLNELAPHLDGEPDPAFRAATRARLVAMAAVRTSGPEPVTGLRRLLAGRAPDSAPARWRSRLTAGVAGAAMAVTALATLVAVSTDARPGDVLYGLKRSTEQTQLALAGDARGQTLLDFAATRLDELEGLVDEGPSAMSATSAGPVAGTVLAADADPAIVLDTLRTMDDQTAEGAAWLTERSVTTEDAAPLEDLAGWAADQSDGLTALTPRLPDEAAEAAQASLGLLSDISTRVTGLQSAIGCAGGPAVNGGDALGPVPGLCVPERAAVAPGGGGTNASTAPVPGAPAPTLPPATTSDDVPPGGQSAGTGGPSAGSGSGSGSGGGAGGGAGGVEVPTPELPVPDLPTPELPVPDLPVSDLPLPDVPLPLPGQGEEGGADSSSPPVVGVPSAPVTLCLPPLATIGDC